MKPKAPRKKPAGQSPSNAGAKRISRITMPTARVEEQDMHFTIKYAVWCGPNEGGTSIGYFDHKKRADLVAAAINSFRRTPAGKRWWQEQVKEGTKPIKPTNNPIQKAKFPGEKLSVKDFALRLEPVKQAMRRLHWTLENFYRETGVSRTKLPNLETLLLDYAKLLRDETGTQPKTHRSMRELAYEHGWKPFSDERYRANLKNFMMRRRA